MTYEEINKEIEKVKISIKKLIKRKKINEALSLISACAEILYISNIKYVDNDLEDYIEEISMQFKKNLTQSEVNDDAVLFYDGFGLDTRGLAQIYIKALVQKKKVIYVTYDSAKNRIPRIKALVEKSLGEVFFIDDNKIVNKILDLQSLIERCKPKDLFFYSMPNDVVGVTALNIYKNITNNIQINLTDHAFWLGAKPIDYCIEFRSYGANISRYYRNIPQNKLVRIPFYPVIDYSQKFAGFPFEVKKGNKVIFSGGALYKTFSENNNYYKIVDYILSKYPYVIFWYAGFGNRNKIDTLINKYPGRVYFTEERKDLYQVLSHSYFYLSTYPLCGGLMFQYAALASKVPLTLRFGNITDEFLINQEDLGIQFDDLDSLYKEIDRLMLEDDYIEKKNKNLKKSVISENQFSETINQFLDTYSTNFFFNYKKFSEDVLKENYLDNFSKKLFYECFAKKEFFSFIKILPKNFFIGSLYKVVDKLKEK